MNTTESVSIFPQIHKFTLTENSWKTVSLLLFLLNSWLPYPNAPQNSVHILIQKVHCMKNSYNHKIRTCTHTGNGGKRHTFVVVVFNVPVPRKQIKVIKTSWTGTECTMSNILLSHISNTWENANRNPLPGRKCISHFRESFFYAYCYFCLLYTSDAADER